MIIVFTVLFGLIALDDWRRGIRPFDRVRDNHQETHP